MSSPEPKYRRVLLKLSGEALLGDQSFGIDSKVLERVADEVTEVFELGVQLAIVLGGGNIIRGVTAAQQGIDRVVGDNMGMLSTVINSLAMSSALQHRGLATRVQSAIAMHQIAEPVIRLRAIRHLEKGRIVLFAGGTGNPFFTTDSAAALRAAEIEADVLIKATKVDGVYTSDPAKDPDAKFLSHLTFDEAVRRQIRVMDQAAFSLCHESNIPIKVLNISKPGILARVVLGEQVGSLVGPEEAR